MTDGATDRTGTTKVGRTRRWAGALLLGGTLAVLAAALVGLSISASSRSPASITREPLELHPKGDFTHPAGFLMPEKAGPFERVEVLQYDEAGRNLSAGYNAVVGGEMPLPIFVTLYGPRQFVGRYAVFGYERLAEAPRVGRLMNQEGPWHSPYTPTAS